MPLTPAPLLRVPVTAPKLALVLVKHVVFGLANAGGVGQVEALAAEFHPEALGDLKRLEHRQIDSEHSGPAHEVAAGAAEHARSEGLREVGGGEPGIARAYLVGDVNRANGLAACVSPGAFNAPPFPPM